MTATWTVETLREDVRDFLAETFLQHRGDAPLEFDDDLLVVLNSLQLLRMVLELESRYGIQIDNSELTPENLGSVSRVARFVASKRN